MSIDLRKPAAGSGKVARYENRLKRRALTVKQVRQGKLAERALNRALRFGVYLRDGRRDRAFGTPLLFETDNLLKQSHAHHLTFRSAGGADDAANLITVSFRTHEMLHNGLLDAEGDGNSTVTFTEYRFEGGTRTVLRVWESTV